MKPLLSARVIFGTFFLRFLVWPLDTRQTHGYPMGMGATDFMDIGQGKTASEAFRNAHDNATWEHGHGGYTGTVAEKGGFVLLTRPPRVSARKVVDTIGLAVLHDANIHYSSHTPKREVDKMRREHKKAYDQVVAWYGAQAESIIRQYDDKWGHALAIEADPTHTKSLRGRYGEKPKRGTKYFMFFGLASC